MEFSILYQELQNSTEMIRALLAGVEPEAARLKPSAESWSILEVVCHLYWVAHDNLHLRQLVELRRLRLENITRPYHLEYAGDW